MNKNFSNEFKELFVLTIPILLTQIAQVSMGFVDASMSGHAGTIDLAAVALGSSFWMPIILFGQGLLMAIIPNVARIYHSRKHRKDVSNEIYQAIWLALFLSLILFGVIHAIIAILPSFGYEEKLTDMTRRYLAACSYGLPGYLVFSALRCGMDGMSNVRIAMNTALFGVLLNILGNYTFIFGHFGFEPMGGVGSGVATAIVCYGLAITMFLQIYLQKNTRSILLRFCKPDMQKLKHIVNVGLPNALALLCEVSMFCCVSILLAPLGAVAVASNQVALSFSGMIFMLPLSISMATSIRVGIRLGQDDKQLPIVASRAALTMCLIGAICSTTAILVLRHYIPYIFTKDVEVMAIASNILIYTAIYQIPDSVQVVVVGALRAYNDTKPILLINSAAYWIGGIPLGYVLARTNLITEPMAAIGFWIAIDIFMALAAIALFLRLRQQENKFINNTKVFNF